ncbi:hypothetical protein [Bradyrhizobium cosmicum]|uniref:hypothetical protein n=1 Tax=Bradyrhizobium cosmicum TaxID=1404864 RepID=UPI0028E974DA|nr:hypothetical protein [Bradyrhizobium cosmicum]
MDTTSVVTLRPALTGGEAGMQGPAFVIRATASACAPSSPSQIRSTSPRNPTKVVRL